MATKMRKPDSARLVRRRVRMQPGDFRAVREADGLPQTFTAVVLRYNVVDDYNTRFRPGVFNESMVERMPRICWAHDWANPIGRWTDVVRNDELVLELRGEFDDFSHVPDARRAASQLASGTIDQFSVGFYLLEERDARVDDPAMPAGVWDITEGELVEASPVLLGAVPGTSLTGMRSTPTGLLVPLEEVERIIVSLGAGTVDLVDAIQGAREVAVAEADVSVEVDASDDGAVDEDESDSDGEGDDAVAEDEPDTDDADDTDDEGEVADEADEVIDAEFDSLVAALDLAIDRVL